MREIFLMSDKMTVGMVALGCPKNMVDGEMMIAKMEDDGFTYVDYLEKDADVVIVNTCGFIDDAKKEAIENIFEVVQMKKDGTVGAVVVTGCLAQRYKQEILREIPEVDAVVGLGANAEISVICREVLKGRKLTSFPPEDKMPLNGPRELSTPEYWAYLRIADGCSNCCTYCAIPSIRGKFRSRKMEDIIEEATMLALSGVKEIIVVAQDTTRYGEDIYGELKLPELLDRLCEIEGIKWIRLFYCYPDRITDELLSTMARQEKILNYMDIPLQHAHGKILKAMNRTGDRESLTKLIEKIRGYMPDVVIRTTLMTGFPGEGEEEFETLAEFVREIKFDRLGCFAFSPQEGTPAFKMEQDIDEETKLRRGEIIMDEQYRIVEEKSEEIMGRELEVLIEGYDSYSDCYYGRSYMDAPEIDTVIYFSSPNPYTAGDFAKVVIFDRDEYDLIGKEVE